MYLDKSYASIGREYGCQFLIGNVSRIHRMYIGDFVELVSIPHR